MQAVLACVASCGAGESLPPIRYETETTVVGTAFEDPLCAGDLAFLDKTVRFAEEMLGVEAETPIEVYLYDVGEVPCEESPFGCYTPGTGRVTSLWAGVDHELVHAVSTSIKFPSTFWEEGVAEALNGAGTHLYDRMLSSDALTSVERPNYAAAGHFVRWLIETRGMDRLNRAIRQQPLEKIYGQSAEELVADYNETAPWGYPAWAPCPQPEVPQVSDGSWAESLTFSCETELATAKEWYGTSLFRTLALEAGTYEITLAGGLGALVVGCQMDVLEERPVEMSHGDLMNEAERSQTAFGTFLESGKVHEITITDGVYRFAISSGVYGPATMDISVRRTS